MTDPPEPEPSDGIADLPTSSPIAGVDQTPPPVPSSPPPFEPPPAASSAPPEATPPPIPEPPPEPETESFAAAPAPPSAEPERAMPSAEAGPGLTDPNGLGAAVSRLSGGGRKQGHAAFMVLARVLEPGEQISVVTSCRFRGAPAALAVSDRRLLVVNAREWEPDVLPVGFEPGLTVQGWQDERHAALVFTLNGHELVVDQIVDRAMAQEIAVGVRSKVGG